MAAQPRTTPSLPVGTARAATTRPRGCLPPLLALALWQGFAVSTDCFTDPGSCSHFWIAENPQHSASRSVARQHSARCATTLLRLSLPLLCSEGCSASPCTECSSRDHQLGDPWGSHFPGGHSLEASSAAELHPVDPVDVPVPCCTAGTMAQHPHRPAQAPEARSAGNGHRLPGRRSEVLSVSPWLLLLAQGHSHHPWPME